MQNEIQVVFGVYDATGEYSKYAGVTIASILKNTNSNIRIHIIHDNTLTEKNKKYFSHLISIYGQHIKFHMIQLEKEIERCTLGTIKRCTPGAFFRLKICDILKDYPKVIYLDSDILVNMDIKKMWDEDLENHALGAVLDSHIQRGHESRICKGFPINSYKYFNSGVLLLDIHKINMKYNFYHDSLEFFYKYPDVPCSDQAAINYLLQDDCVFLDEKYNFSMDNHDCNNIDVAIYHFTGDKYFKPWRAVRENPVYKEWWKILYGTPWMENNIDIFNDFIYQPRLLDEVMMHYPIKSRKAFLVNFSRRFFGELKRFLGKSD